MSAATRIARLAVLAGATVWATGVIAGCHGQHPDVQAAVYQALSQHDLGSVEVYQDRGSGVITLKGIVGSPDRKTSADQLARQAAPGYRVDDRLTVNNDGIVRATKPNQQAPGAGNNSTPSATAPAADLAH